MSNIDITYRAGILLEAARQELAEAKVRGRSPAAKALRSIRDMRAAVKAN